MSESAYYSRYSLQFASQLDGLGWCTYERVAVSIDNLECNPYLGHTYEPEYEASPPQMQCRCLYVPRTTKVLYYTVDDELRTMDFFYIDDTRMDPRRRFEDMA